MDSIVKGALFGVIAQILTFLQLQGSIRYGWFEKHPLWLLLSGLPISLFYIYSVKYLVVGYDGAIWPSRIIGFGIGIVVFTVMSTFLFNEQITPKTLVCIALASIIIAIQVLWK